MKKEDWINSIIESSRDFERKNPPENLFPKVLKKINNLSKEIEPYAWLKIAAILVVSISFTHKIVSHELKPKPEIDSIELVSRNNNMIYE